MCYVNRVHDTSAEAAAVQAQVHRAMSGARKVLIACQMSNAVRGMAMARIKASNPSLDEAGVRDQLVWELYGFRRQR